MGTMSDLMVTPHRGGRFVLFADILGFKDLVRANSLIAVTQLIRHVIQDGCVRAVLRGADPNSATSLDVRIISDSIIIWTDSDEPTEFMNLVVAMRFLLALTFVQGVPLRGAITWGELDLVSDRAGRSIKTESVVGKALVDAYEAESVQEWSGGLVTEEAVRRYSMLVAPGTVQGTPGQKPTIDVMNGLGWLVPFDIPTKHGAVRGEAVGWPTVLNEKVNRGAIRDSFGDHGKSINSGVEVKIQNTIRFVDSCRMLNGVST
jgi:hypothetical protein